MQLTALRAITYGFRSSPSCRNELKPGCATEVRCKPSIVDGVVSITPISGDMTAAVPAALLADWDRGC